MDPGVSATVAAPGRGQRLSVPVAAPLAAYLLARAVTLAVVMLTPSGVSVARRVLAFDAGWYALIATNGYPHSVAQGPDGVIANRVGFFPAYPLLVRGLQAATPLPVWAAELAVSLIAGAAATVLVAAVCAEVSGWVTGRRAAVCWAVLPQSFLFVIGYSEGLFVAAAAGALLLLLHERWVGAGLAAAVASATRPTGLVLALAALAELVRRRSLQPLPALLLAPTGAIAYMVWIGDRTHQPDAWLVTERQGWNAYQDLGMGTAKYVGYSLLNPTARPWYNAISVVIIICALLWLGMFRMRLPLPVLVYTTGVLFLAVTSGPGVFSSIPRIAYTAFPLAVPLAAAVGRIPAWLRGVLLVVSIVAACALGVIVTTTHHYTP
jgi:hypothetical protein